MQTNKQRGMVEFLLSGGGARVAKISRSPVVPVLIALTSTADDDMVVRCSQTSLSQNLGMSRATLHRAIVDLEKFGCIERMERSRFKISSVENIAEMFHHETNESRMFHHETNLGGMFHHETNEQRMYHHETNEAKSVDGHTVYNKLLLRSSWCAHAPANKATPPTDQEKIAALEKIIRSKLGDEIWERSTNWAELYNRSGRNIELIEDAVIAYQEKVLGANRRHSFVTLMNFVKMEKENAQKRKAQDMKRSGDLVRENRGYDAVFADESGKRATDEEIKFLERFLDGR